jgi:regulator of protease activity HflC (stomatin/prohibitin superfamily)
VQGAFEWIGKLVDWIAQFFPRWIILTPVMGAVKFVRGSRAVALGAGIHWYWPATTTVESYPTARQTDNLPTQTLVTSDDKTIAISAMVVYEVEDIEKLLAHTYSAEKTIQDLCLSAIRRVCCKMTWDDLKTEDRRGTLDTKLKNAAKWELENYGIRVLGAVLTDLAPCRVLRLVQSTASDT